MKNTLRVLFGLLGTLLLISSCMTTAKGFDTRFAIDNSRMKHEPFDPLDLSVLVLSADIHDTDGRFYDEILIDRIMEQSPSIVICSGDEAFLTKIREDLPMNMAILQDGSIIAARYHILSRYPSGALIQLDQAHTIAVGAEAPDDSASHSSPMLFTGNAGEDQPGFSDVYAQTHAEGEASVSLFYRGLLPLETTDIQQKYAGFQGILALFAVPDPGDTGS